MSQVLRKLTAAAVRNSTCVAFINQIADYNAGARNVGFVR